MKQLAEEFREFLRYLNEEKVEYLVIGGYAVSLHGYTRFTADMDIWIAMERVNARRVVHALERFGFVHGEAGEELPFISRDDLVANKKASGRPKDLGDLEGLGE